MMIRRVAASLASAARLVAVCSVQSLTVSLALRPMMGTFSSSAWRSPAARRPSRVRVALPLAAPRKAAARLANAAAVAVPGGGASGDGGPDFAPSATAVLWVKKEDDARFVRIRSRAEDVDDLTREIAKELGLTDRLSTLTLHQARDELGREIGPALRSDATIRAALPGTADAMATSRVVVRVAPPSPGRDSAPLVELWVKKEGDADYAVLMVQPTQLVGLLKEEIVKELRLTDRLSTLTLHVAGDKLGAETGVALKSDAPLNVALASVAADSASVVVRLVVKGVRNSLAAVGRGANLALVPDTSAYHSKRGVVFNRVSITSGA